MKTIITGEPVAQWVGNQIGRMICTPYEAIGVELDGSIIGGVVFNLWTGPNVHVTAAGSPRVWSRIFLRRLAAYAFGELGCARVTFTTENPVAADVCRRLGAQHEGTMRSAYGPGRDGMIFGLLKDDWRI